MIYLCHLIFYLSCTKTPPSILEPGMPSIQNEAIQLGEVVTISGVAQQSKAGALIQVENFGDIWCVGISSWPSDKIEQTVRVQGAFELSVSPMDSFPVAVQDEHGAWSQGVGSPEITLSPSNDIMEEATSKPEGLSPKKSRVFRVDTILD